MLTLHHYRGVYRQGVAEIWQLTLEMEWYTIGTLIVLVVVVAAYLSPGMARKNITTAEGPYSLAVNTTLATIDMAKPLFAESAGSFSAFLYLSPMNRTGAHADCGTNPNQASCGDGTFAPCPCDAATNDCSVCDHVGYNNVLNLSGTILLEVLNAPDAGRKGKALAQILLKTEGASLSAGSTNSQKYIETMILPPISIQKWTMITIAREGRRFDIYYNDTIVHSQKTMYMPISDTSKTNLRGITSGSSGLVGEIAMANVYNYRMSSQDVKQQYKDFADTRGSPFIASTANPITTSDPSGLNPGFVSGTTLSSFFSSGCTSGACVNPPVVRPASSMYDWTSPYG